MEEYQKKFIERTKHHIDLVNKYARKIKHLYKYHDYDKLQGVLFEPYSLMSKCDYKDLSDDEKKRYNEATIKHITSQPHHPEYWLSRSDLTRVREEFTRDNQPMNLDCSKMSKEGILEMCCDWCAMSEEFGNTPLEWMQRTCGILDLDDNCRWLFTVDQIQFMINTICELWG